MEEPTTFEDISTVQDLLKFNETDETEVKYDIKAKELLRTIYKEDPQVGLRIARSVLESLEDFHLTVSREMTGNSQEVALMWMTDASKLRAAIETIDDIAL